MLINLRSSLSFRYELRLKREATHGWLGELECEHHAVAARQHVPALRCLDPAQRCLSDRDLSFRFFPNASCAAAAAPLARILCARAMWRCPRTGVLVSLPRITDSEMSALYSSHYGGQANLAGPNNSRSLGQAADIRRALGHRSGGGSGLHLVEIGCASGYVLYNLRDLAADGGNLTISN